MIFSLATLLDLTLPPNNVDAEFYHQLARAGLSCDPILVEPTVPAIQTLVMTDDTFPSRHPAPRPLSLGIILLTSWIDAHVILPLGGKPEKQRAGLLGDNRARGSWFRIIFPGICVSHATR